MQCLSMYTAHCLTPSHQQLLAVGWKVHSASLREDNAQMLLDLRTGNLFEVAEILPHSHHQKQSEFLTMFSSLWLTRRARPNS